MAAPSIFTGGGPAINYPAYLVKFTLTGATHFGDGLAAFFLADGNTQDGAFPGNAVLDVASATGLISAIATYLEGNGWDGGTVSDLTVTKYTEASADVTP